VLPVGDVAEHEKIGFLPLQIMGFAKLSSERLISQNCQPKHVYIDLLPYPYFAPLLTFFEISSTRKVITALGTQVIRLSQCSAHKSSLSPNVNLDRFM